VSAGIRTAPTSTTGEAPTVLCVGPRTARGSAGRPGGGGGCGPGEPFPRSRRAL